MLVKGFENNGKRRNKFPEPPVPLILPKTDSPKKDEVLKMVLKSTPSDRDSSTYSVTIRYFEDGTPAEWIHFLKDFKKILNGQSITTPAHQYAMLRNLIRGDALRVFDAKATYLGDETAEHFSESLKGLTTHIFPLRALVKQKRYMRRHMRKPRELTTRQYAARIVEMSEDLTAFPNFEDSNKFSDDELMDIYENTNPVKWQSELLRQGFDPTAKSYDDLIDFYERQEALETWTNAVNNKQDKNGTSRSSTKSQGDRTKKTGATNSAKSTESGFKSKKRNADAWCPLHNTDSHDMSECKVINEQVKKMRTAYASVGSSNYGNKRYYREKNDKKTKEDLNAMVRRVVEERLNNSGGVKSSKKRLKSETESDIDSDEESANMIERMTLYENSDSE